MIDLNLARTEEKLITIALAWTAGDRRKAAKLLGIPVKKLWRKIRARRGQK